MTERIVDYQYDQWRYWVYMLLMVAMVVSIRSSVDQGRSVDQQPVILPVPASITPAFHDESYFDSVLPSVWPTPESTPDISRYVQTIVGLQIEKAADKMDSLVIDNLTERFGGLLDERRQDVEKGMENDLEHDPELISFIKEHAGLEGYVLGVETTFSIPEAVLDGAPPIALMIEEVNKEEYTRVGYGGCMMSFSNTENISYVLHGYGTPLVSDGVIFPVCPANVDAP